MHSRSALAVECLGITKEYGSGETAVPALRGIDLTVNPGELLMLVGPSGCGKTTLISVIAGILNHDKGKCFLLGKDLDDVSKMDRTRDRGKEVGFVFQSFNLIPSLTTVENVAVPLLINGYKRNNALIKAEECLAQVGLAGREQAMPSQLSGGQQQRTAIARAIVHNPRLIVCDEPTSALDHETGQRVMEVLRSVAVTQERALVIVTHDSRIFSFADRIAHMDDGRIVRIESMKESALCS